MPSSSPTGTESPDIFLIGAGVVGRAIFQAHLKAGISVCLADKVEASVAGVASDLKLDPGDWSVSELTRLGDDLTAILVRSRRESGHREQPLVIESISERLDVKRSFFESAEHLFGDNAILCSNTSTLRIGNIAETFAKPQRFCGMHFFMPVDRRDAVEVIAGETTSQETIEQCMAHVKGLNKEPLVVGDGPGFVVNRLLSPYLNEAMLMLGRGIPAAQIEKAALTYGMPMSPLELIDWIGTRTMFDAGRVYWQSFPSRLDAAPMLSAFIKNKRLGRATDAGLYDYVDGQRSAELSPVAIEYCDRYRRNEMKLGDTEVLHMLSIPMWIEAALTWRDGIVPTIEHFNLAMRGGLGFAPNRRWSDFFDSLGSETLLAAIDKWSPVTASMKCPDDLARLLETLRPTEALQQFAVG